MNSCARCNKLVYPTEELRCLEKTWHRICFKCNECGMSLNMKTYKGLNKIPYCEAHYPKTKATTMADTPEFKRNAANTKIQSNVDYHLEKKAVMEKQRPEIDEDNNLHTQKGEKVSKLREKFEGA